MKAIFSSIILSLFVINLSYSQQGWNYLDANLTNNEHGALDVLDANSVFIIGDSGQFRKTTDGGENWTALDLGIDEIFNDIFFYDNLFGIAVGANGTIVKTDDGGENWDSISSGIVYNLVSVFIVNPNSCWIIGSDDTILFSDDSGNSWSLIDINSKDKSSLNNHNSRTSFNQVFFRNENEGYILGMSHILYQTMDGGIDWGSLWYGFYTYFSSMSKTENYLYLLHDTWLVLKSTDGINWDGDYALPFTALDLYFQNDNLGFCIASDCTTNGDCFIGISKSVNSGVTWTTSFDDWNPPNNISYHNNDIEFATDTIGYALSGDNVLKTIDGGTYIGVNELDNDSLLRIYPNPTDGILKVSVVNASIDEIEIKNIMGQSVFSYKNVQNNKIDIDISDFSNGTYFIYVNDINGVLRIAKLLKI